jgi:hypothetical protein
MATTAVHYSSPTAFFVVPPVLQSWVDICLFSWRCESTLRIFYFLICQLLLHFNVSTELLYSKLLCRAGVVGDVLLMVQSITGLLMSPEYGGYQSTTPP